MGAIRLYFRYVGLSFRSQLEYRASFILQTLGHMLLTGLEILGMWALFSRFGSVRGWRLAEVALFYGLINITFSIADALGRGFDLFARTIRSGDFDRVLLRPRSCVLQILGTELTLRRVGRFAQGLAVFIWAASELHLSLGPLRIGLILFTVAGGVCLFLGLLVLQATMTFWTTESLEIWSTVTYGGVETAQYPLTIYRPWFRKFFTYVVPLACIAYYPMLAIVGRPDAAPLAVQYLSPLAGVAFLAASLRVWQFGVRHYTSTGS